jgi:hypothetical protein
MGLYFTTIFFIIHAIIAAPLPCPQAGVQLPCQVNRLFDGLLGSAENLVNGVLNGVGKQ